MPPIEPAPTKKKTGDDPAARSPASPAANAVPPHITSPVLQPPTIDVVIADRTPAANVASPSSAAPSEDTDALLRRRLASLGELEDELRAKMRDVDAKLGLTTSKPDMPSRPVGRGKQLGLVPVYENDTQEDFIERAREVRKGKIPVARARRFKTTARITAVMNGDGAWPMASRLKEAALPLGFEFDADEMPLAERQAYFEAEAIEPIE